MTGPAYRPRLLQQSHSAVHWAGATSAAASPSYSAGSERHLDEGGSVARLTTTARSLSFITTLGPNRGSAMIYVDGLLAATVDLNAATTTYRYVAFTRTWSSVGTHTIRIVAVGTLDHPRVDVDAFGVLR